MNSEMNKFFKEIYKDYDFQSLLKGSYFSTPFDFYRNKLKYNNIEILRLTPMKKKGRIRK